MLMSNVISFSNISCQKKSLKETVGCSMSKNLFQFHKITLNMAVLSLFITVYAFFASFFHPGQFHHSYSALQ